jgi:hypothetical protein
MPSYLRHSGIIALICAVIRQQTPFRGRITARIDAVSAHPPMPGAGFSGGTVTTPSRGGIPRPPPARRRRLIDFVKSLVQQRYRDVADPAGRV